MIKKKLKNGNLKIFNSKALGTDVVEHPKHTSRKLAGQLNLAHTTALP